MVRRRPVYSAVLGTVVGILILASGCVDQNPAGVQLTPARAVSAARSYPAGTYTATIGREGGTLELPIGRINFPAGALTETTKINAKVDGKTIAVNFQPHLEFPGNARPTLTLSFQGVNINPTELRVFHISDSGNVIEDLIPSVDQVNQTATTDVSSFSGFILGAG